MLTVKECREILDQDAEGLTDDEVIKIRDWLSTMADITIELEEKSGSVNEIKRHEETSNHLHQGINR